MDLKYIFEPRSVAIIGASRDPTKVGHAVLRNFLESGYQGQIYPINPTADVILDQKCYPNVLEVPGSVDCAVIAVPSVFVARVLKESGEKGTKGAIVISSGFAEVGNVQGEQELVNIAKQYDMAMAGPNCLGVVNTTARVDSIFLPMYKLERPKVGGISFMTQSGAVGSCSIDLAANLGIGVSKFVAYGNAAVVNESDFLEYFGKDPKTKVIAAYFESIKEGERFMKIAKEVTANKPVVAIKGGKTSGGIKAAASHTAALAGNAEVYSAAFRQTRIIEVESLTDLFDYTKIFLQPMPKGNNVAVLTNGGGIGVLTADWIEKQGLKLAQFSDEATAKLRERMPKYVNIINPLDISGDTDAERYKFALDTLVADDSVDSIIAVVLFQTVSLGPEVNDVVIAASDRKAKPIITISIGGDYTQTNRVIFESSGVPSYSSPYVATGALAKLTWYSRCIGEGVCKPMD